MAAESQILKQKSEDRRQMTEDRGQGMNTRLRLRCSFRLSAFGYVYRKAWLSTLNDTLRLAQALSAVVATKAGPIRAAQPVDEDAEFGVNYAKQSQFPKC